MTATAENGRCEPAIHSLDHIVLSIPDLEQGSQFFTAFGLDSRRTGDAVELRCFGSGHVSIKLVARGGRHVQEIVFGAYPDMMAAHRQTVEGLGVADLRLHDDGSLSFKDPEGVPLRIIPAEKCTPNEKTAPSASHHPARAGTCGAPLRAAAAAVRPRYFAHVGLFTGDVVRNVEFYGEALGLRLSDEVVGEVAFLHAAHGSEHHLVGFARSRGPGFHHSAWDVGSVQEVGLGMMQMAEAGYAEGGWGVGRHVLGSNYFHYVKAPWGGYAEYSFDIDYIPAGHVWKPGRHRIEDAMYLWGPPPPQGYDRNIEFALEHDAGGA